MEQTCQVLEDLTGLLWVGGSGQAASVQAGPIAEIGPVFGVPGMPCI